MPALDGRGGVRHHAINHPGNRERGDGDNSSPRSAEGGVSGRAFRRRCDGAETYLEGAEALDGMEFLGTAEAGELPTGKSSPSSDHKALAWHAFLWDPWFLVWGLLLAAALTLTRRPPIDRLRRPE